MPGPGFQKGHPKMGGRQKGTPNKLTATVRETFERVFNSLQEDPKQQLEAFARDNPVEFHKLIAKLLPIDLAVQGGVTLNVITGVPGEESDEEFGDLL